MQQQGSRNRSKAHPIIRELPLDQLKRVLTEHRAWLDSDGKSGEKAGLSRAQLQGLSLWSADLREADLSYANLQARLWITLACAAPTCGMQRWKVPRCGGLICGMQIPATPASSEQSWTTPIFRVPICTTPISPEPHFGERCCRELGSGMQSGLPTNS
jgi:Pentapeptide repeats (8 copies)